MKRRIFGVTAFYCPACEKNVFSKGPGVGMTYTCGECGTVTNTWPEDLFEETPGLQSKSDTC